MLDLNGRKIVYVTRDLERALGLPLSTAGYFIISNSTPFAKTMTGFNNNVLLIESDKVLDTYELLTHPQTINFIEKISTPQILVFKNTTQIEKICAGQNWPLLNPSAELANKVEEKISQVEWLGDLAKFLPPHQIHPLQAVWFDGTPFIIQFNRAHTGLGTILIDSQTKLDKLKTQFPNRPGRVTKFINGTMFTSNNVVTPTKILVGNINAQITGQAPFTDEPFATVGNDFALAQKLLSSAQTQKYTEIVTAVGDKLRESGWKGLFGTDIMLEKTTGTLFLIEINARQPAGTVFESELQITNNPPRLTTFSAHLLSLMGSNLTEGQLIKITTGAQIILRNQKNRKFSAAELKNISQKLRAKNFTVIGYENTKPGSDLLRIQSDKGIMTGVNTFSEIGSSILNILA